MAKDAALKLALEALEGVLDDSPKVMDASISGGLYEVVQCREAITAIKEALAQPPQRPWVALTNDEVNNFAAGCHLGKSVQGAIYEAEAKLKEKNT
jgi:hypothetical protein